MCLLIFYGLFFLKVILDRFEVASIKDGEKSNVHKRRTREDYAELGNEIVLLGGKSLGSEAL